MKNKLKKIMKSHATFIVGYAFILNLVIELLSRETISSLIHHLTHNTIFFLNNVFILSFTFSISYFFKKKRFVVVLVSALWLCLGIANYIVLTYRITPFAAIDLLILQINFEFMSKYMSIPLATGVCVAIALGIYASVKAFLHTKKTEVKHKKAILQILCLASGVFITQQLFLSAGIFETRITNMAVSYDHFGFVSCFARSVIERGIIEPEDYSETRVDELLTTIHKDNTNENKPNIVVVQLESFFDPSLLKGVEFSENPIPNFTSLSNKYSSGMFDVAVVGAGTANTEFEVLTGMSVHSFGTGEYPYETILREKTCPSMAYSLKELGYHTFAIHNNTATFYGRNEVYPNLGFDNFISSEFMENTSTTPGNWIKDENLTPEIMKCLQSSNEKDFIFTVSVQGHGAFPKEEMEDKYVSITTSPFEEDLENQIEYYVNQLHEMDMFIQELVNEINQLDEDTILVLYGDHIPALDIYAKDLVTENNYQTQYVVYSNYDLPVIDQDLHTYQLLSSVLESVGICNNPIIQLHQSDEKVNYEANLELLQYDLLYGKNYANINLIPTNMLLGVGGFDFTITPNSNRLIKIEGANITEYSHVFVNDKEIETFYYENHALYIESTDIEVGDTLTIKQMTSDNEVLLTSKAMKYLKETH